MGMRRLQIAVVSGLGVALVAAGGVIVHQSRKLAEVQQQRDAALQSLQETQEALHESELRIAAIQETPKPVDKNKAVIAQQNTKIKQLTSELEAAQAGIKQFQEKLAATQNENEKAMASADQRHQEQQATLQASLEQLQQELKSTKVELQSSRQRITDLQKTNDQLTAANNEGTTRLAERERILRSLQDLDRRRESHLRSIADRYRNITNQFRTMSGMLDSNRGRDSSTFSGPALDMIQNAITLTDNDLQQLGELDAKAYRLEKRLSKK